MNVPKKHVNINLKTIINDGLMKEENELSTAGEFLQKGNLDVIKFKEKFEESEITTLVTIQKEKVSIKRSGVVSMHQQFWLDRLTENVYKHPHGNIHMETFTTNMTYIPFETNRTAKLELVYSVKLNGQTER